MIVNNQAGAVQQPRPNKAAANTRRANTNAQNPSAAKRAPQNAAVDARQTAQNTRRPSSAAQNQSAQRPSVQNRPDEKTLSRTAMMRKNAINANNNPQPKNSKAFEAYQEKLTEIIKKHDKNGDMKLSLAETGAPKEDFAKIDLNRDGFVDKAEMESKVSARINAMEEILLADPGKLVKMMKELGPEISDKVGGKDSYKKIVKNLKILEANDRANGGKELKTKGNVNFMA